jgi:PREDICTED: similar to DNA-directed RNA polymerase II largest subunit
MAKNKKNELDMLLGAIKKNLNNKMSLDNKDIETAMDILKINKLKKEIIETLETMCNFKYTSKEKTKETLETLKNFLEEDFESLKKTEDEETERIKEENKKKKKKTTAKKTDEVKNDNEVVEEKTEEKVENLSEVQENNFY